MHYNAHVYCCVTFTVQVNVYEYQPVSERKWRGREGGRERERGTERERERERERD